MSALPILKLEFLIQSSQLHQFRDNILSGKTLSKAHSEPSPNRETGEGNEIPTGTNRFTETVQQGRIFFFEGLYF